MTLSILRHGLFAALTAALPLAACNARADHDPAGSFDGKWEFDMTFTSDSTCTFEGRPLVTLLRSGHADGLYTEPNYGGRFNQAAVQDNGSFEMALGGYAMVRLSGALAGDSGEGDIAVSGTSLLCDGKRTAKKLSQATVLQRRP